MFLGNPKDSVWEDWGTLRNLRGLTTPGPLRLLLQNDAWESGHKFLEEDFAEDFGACILLAPLKFHSESP